MTLRDTLLEKTSGNEDDTAMEITLRLLENGKIGIGFEVEKPTQKCGDACVDFITDKFVGTGIGILKKFMPKGSDIEVVRRCLRSWVEHSADLLSLTDEELLDLIGKIGEVEEDLNEDDDNNADG